MYISKGLYEWNIDGCSEHEILNIFHEIIMAATAYSTENEDHEVVEFLLAAFTGVLRGWWENSLNDEERKFIKTSINKITGEQNVVHILVYTISKHFIGDNKILQERNSEILQKLRCRTLSDFQWYHDVFVSKVMTRGDARTSYWKERFMFGLPSALTKKVQETLRERVQGTIPYDNLTYGDLISEIKKEGLKLCSQIKLQHKLK